MWLDVIVLGKTITIIYIFSEITIVSLALNLSYTYTQLRPLPLSTLLSIASNLAQASRPCPTISPPFQPRPPYKTSYINVSRLDDINYNVSKQPIAGHNVIDYPNHDSHHPVED